MYQLEVVNVSKQFGDKIVHQQFNYTFKNGCYLLVGENGVGKTVILEILAGVMMADTGEVRLNKIHGVTSLDYKQQLVYVPGNPEFFPMISGDEFISFVCSVKRKSPCHTNLHKEYSGYQLENHLSTQFKNMSLGTKKKIFLSTLGIQQDAVVLLDEPTNALDGASQLYLKNVIKEISMNAIVIIATHDLSFFKDIDHTVVNLNNGTLFS